MNTINDHLIYLCILNFNNMRTKINLRIRLLLVFIFFIPVIIQAQTDKKAAELKKYETGINNAKAKVALNERQLTVADSLLTLGTEMVAESKTDIKAAEAERKRLDKDYAAIIKPLTKLTTSKDKAEAAKAKADLKGLEVQFKLDAKALDTRLKDANKKLTTGNSLLTKGKTGKKNAQNALKTSRAALDIAQEKYDNATGAGEDNSTKAKKKK